MNGLTSHLPRIYPRLTKIHGRGSQELNMRASVETAAGVYACFTAPCEKQTCHPPHAESEESARREARRPAALTNPPNPPSPLLLTAASTDMPGRYRYGLCTAAAGEINGCVKGDDPQLIRSCLTLLPLVAGPGCCIPGGLPWFLTRKFRQALKRSASLHVFVVCTCGPDSERRRAEGLDFICESSQVMLISRRVRPVNLNKKTRL